MEKSKDMKAGRNYASVFTKLPLFVAIFLLAAAGWQQDNKESKLLLTIEGVRNGSGQLLVSLFRGAEGFPSDGKKAVKIVSVPAQKGAVQVALEGLQPGIYAVAVLHDENANGELDTNIVGYPKEGYGASNNNLPIFRAPDFSEASFQLKEKEQALGLRLRY